jgi:hypothetical protein
MKWLRDQMSRPTRWDHEFTANSIDMREICSKIFISTLENDRPMLLPSSRVVPSYILMS